MTILDRYIFSEWFKFFLLTAGVTLGLRIVEDVYDDLPDLVDYQATFRQVLAYYFFLTPTFIPTILPIALLISLLFSLGSLHRNNEILSMRAAGLTLSRISRSLWLAGVLLACLLLWLNGRIVPWAVEQSRTFSENLKFATEAKSKDTASVGLVYNLSFNNWAAYRLWFMNRFSQFTYQGFGVTVFLLDKDGREQARIMAREAYYDDNDGLWVFSNGRELSFNQKGEPIRSLAFEEKIFSDFEETPQLILTLRKRPKDLSLFELSGLLDNVSHDPQLKAYAVQYYRILASPLICLIALGLAIPFAVSGVRINPIVRISQSVGLFFIYYLLVNLSTILGNQLLPNALITACLPHIIALSFTFPFYYWKGNRV